MMTATTITQWIVRITGMTQVALGLLFWTDRALSLVPLHMAIGLTFVLGLWTLAGLAARAGLRPILVILAVGWGFVVPAFGMMQTRLLPGPWHWTVEVTHLLIGFVAMAVAARLAGFIRKHPRAHSAGRTMDAVPLQG